MSRPLKPVFTVPGTPEAAAVGCTCDPEEVRTLKEGGYMWRIDPDCPAHRGSPGKQARSRREIAEGKYYTLGPGGTRVPGPGIKENDVREDG